MPSHAQLKTLRGSRQTPATTSVEFKQEIVEALAAAGVATTLDPESSAGPHTVLALLKDAGLSVRLWAIPDANLDTSDRARLATIAGRCFGVYFTADLAPNQFAGALLALVRTGELNLGGPEDGIQGEIAAEFEAEGVDMPVADWAKIAGDVWGGRDVTSGLGPIELTHFYAIHVAV